MIARRAFFTGLLCAPVLIRASSLDYIPRNRYIPVTFTDEFDKGDGLLFDDWLDFISDTSNEIVKIPVKIIKTLKSSSSLVERLELTTCLDQSIHGRITGANIKIGDYHHYLPMPEKQNKITACAGDDLTITGLSEIIK